MKKKYKIILISLLFLLASLTLAPFLFNDTIAVLNPKGQIAIKQKDLIVTSTFLMLIVVVPVFILTLVFALKYREGNKNAKYDPEYDSSILAETIWWLAPFIIIVILSVLTFESSHELDPSKPIKSDNKTITVQVVALQWKWLFIYPEHNVASLNYLQIPEKTPIHFEITSDAPMNSFWIPQLGGQIYAMPGMSSQLYLMADEIGSYRGSSANLSGKGFAGMRFVTKATSLSDFEAWVEEAKLASPLDKEEYNKLVEPSEDNPVVIYSLGDKGLYEQVLMKYMMPPSSMQSMNEQETP